MTFHAMELLELQQQHMDATVQTSDLTETMLRIVVGRVWVDTCICHFLAAPFQT